MTAYFPTSIWDGDSRNRDSDRGNLAAPDYRDWVQLISEMIATQDYIINQNIDLGERVIYFGLTPEASLSYSSSIITWNLAESGANTLQIGDGTNYFQINSTGETLLVGTAKRKMTVRPELDSITQIAQAKPTQITVGVFKGYSLPIYSSDNEELFYQVRVPYRWDGTSNFLTCLEVILADVEDVGDTFKLQCSWQHIPHDGVVPITVHDIDVEQVVLSGRNAQYSTYHIHFIVDYDIDGVGNELVSDDIIGFRFRRITSTGTAIDNEIIVISSVVDFQIDKLFGTWIRP